MTLTLRPSKAGWIVVDVRGVVGVGGVGGGDDDGGHHQDGSQQQSPGYHHHNEAWFSQNNIISLIFGSRFQSFPQTIAVYDLK